MIYGHYVTKMSAGPSNLARIGTSVAILSVLLTTMESIAVFGIVLGIFVALIGKA